MREMKRKIAEEEEGLVGDAGGQGALLRELSNTHAGEDEDEAFVADACLNFLTAGERAPPV